MPVIPALWEAEMGGSLESFPSVLDVASSSQPGAQNPADLSPPASLALPHPLLYTAPLHLPGRQACPRQELRCRDPRTHTAWADINDPLLFLYLVDSCASSGGPALPPLLRETLAWNPPIRTAGIPSPGPGIVLS
ncbi:hypothetical protein AAY473_022107 [Plecturocebus cupreus]